MTLCASCGQPRSDSARFCATCGTEYRDSPDDQGPSPEVTRVQPPAETDPFASWYQPATPGAGQNADQTVGSNWQPTQTVQATPAQAAGYPADEFTAANPFSSGNPIIRPAPPGPPFAPSPPFAPGPSGPPFPPGSQTAPPPRGGGGRVLLIVVAVIVVLAAGGGAYALATKLGKHSTAQPPAGGTVGASTPPGSPGASKSPTGTSSTAQSLVAVAPGVSTSGAEPQVDTLLSQYFGGINGHDYTEYASTLNSAAQAKETQSEFDSGYSSTTDSGMTLTDLVGGSGGGLTATVTFTSRQSAAQSVDNSACNAWTLNLYLVPRGSGYLIGPAPSGYQPTYADC